MEETSKRLYREGGWGWVVVFASFIIQFISYGTFKAFGVLLTAMKVDFDTYLWVIGSVGSLYYGVQFMLGPVAGAVARKIGSRYVAVFGGTLYGLGLVLGSTAHSVPVLAASIVVMAGTGAACIYQASKSELVVYFQEKYALAFFLAMAGSPIGMMVYGPLTQVLLDTYGWRGTMLLMGGVSFHLIPCGLLMRPHGHTTQGEYIEVELLQTDDNVNSEHTKSDQKNVCQNLVTVTGLHIFRNITFTTLTVAYMILNIGYGGVIIYMVPNGLFLGLSTTEASVLTTAWGVGNLLGTALTALAMLINPSCSHVLILIAGIVAAVAYVVIPSMTSFVGHMLTMALLSASLDGQYLALSVMSRNLPFSDDIQNNVIGWQSFMSGVSISVADVIAGWLYDATGSFHATFFMFSGTAVGVCLCLLIDFVRLHLEEDLK